MTTYQEPSKSTSPGSDRFAALPDDETLAETVVGLEDHGVSVEVVAATERIYEHSFKLKDARALEAYGTNSRVGKILEIHQEDPGRIHVVLIRRRVGF